MMLRRDDCHRSHVLIISWLEFTHRRSSIVFTSWVIRHLRSESRIASHSYDPWSVLTVRVAHLRLERLLVLRRVFWGLNVLRRLVACHLFKIVSLELAHLTQSSLIWLIIRELWRGIIDVPAVRWSEVIIEIRELTNRLGLHSIFKWQFTWRDDRSRGGVFSTH
jgi:hypothetical protein